MKKKKDFNIGEEYRKSWDYIKSSKIFIFIIIGIFLVLALIGFFVPAPETLSEQIMKFIEELLEKTSGFSAAEMIKFILLNNIQSSFLGMILGIALGIFPIITAVANGYLLGFVSALSVQGGGISTLLLLLPHGIFELPAIFLSLGLGLRLGLPFVFRYFKHYFDKNNILVLILGVLFFFPAIILTLIFNRNLRKEQFFDLEYRLGNSIKIFLLIIVPLLIIAAIIEGLLI